MGLDFGRFHPQPVVVVGAQSKKTRKGCWPMAISHIGAPQSAFPPTARRHIHSVVAGMTAVMIALIWAWGGVGCTDPKPGAGDSQRQSRLDQPNPNAPRDAGSTAQGSPFRAIDDAKWTEAKVFASSFRQALELHKAKNGRRLPGISSGDTASTVGPKINLPSNHRLKSFNLNDFRLENVDSSAGTYTISVTSTHSDGPRGTYTLTSQNQSTGP